MTWAPQRSALEPEHPALVASRARGPILIRPAEYLSPEKLEAIAASWTAMGDKFESPIEHQFGVAAALAFGAAGLRILPQYCLASFRYDFAVLHPTIDQLLALIECDGKAFHSTPEQRANDRAKDNAAIEAGVFVIRFTGSQIAADPKLCATNALGRVRREWRIQ